MTLGSVQPGMGRVLTVKKNATDAIAAGSVCVIDTALTADGWKIAPASAGNKGPFVVAVNKDAAATDAKFAAAFPGTAVTVTADGAIEPGAEVQCSSSTAGQIVVFAGSSVASTPTQADVQNVQGDRLRVVGRYLGHEDELTGGSPATAAADGESDCVIVIGGN